jgi:hypothetical protein
MATRRFGRFFIDSKYIQSWDNENKKDPDVFIM